LCTATDRPSSRPGPRAPPSRTANSFPTFPSLAFRASLQRAQGHLSTWAGEQARGLPRQFLKTKELDIWPRLVLLLPSSQLQNKPEPYTAPVLTPRLGGREKATAGRRRGQGALEGMGGGRSRSLFTARAGVSGTTLNRRRPKAPGNLNGRPYRRARVTDRLSLLFPTPTVPPSGSSYPVTASPPVPTAAGAAAALAPHARPQPAAAGSEPQHWDRSHYRPAAQPEQCLRPHRPGHYSPVHRRAGQCADKRDRQPRRQRVRGGCEKMAAWPARKRPNVAECPNPLLVPRRYGACASRLGMRRRRR